jgi:hypothetical protein
LSFKIKFADFFGCQNIDVTWKLKHPGDWPVKYNQLDLVLGRHPGGVPDIPVKPSKAKPFNPHLKSPTLPRANITKRPLDEDNVESPDTKILKVKEEIVTDDYEDDSEELLIPHMSNSELDQQRLQPDLHVAQDPLDLDDRLCIEQYVDTYLVELHDIPENKKKYWKDFLFFRGKEKMEYQPTKEEYLSFFHHLRHDLNYKGSSLNVRHSM